MPGRRRLDPDVCLSNEVQENLPALRTLEVEPDGEFVARGPHPGLRHGVLGRRPLREKGGQRPGRVRKRSVEGRSLQVDDLGPELSEVRGGPWPRDDSRGVEHPDALQRSERRDDSVGARVRRHVPEVGGVALRTEVYLRTSFPI